MDYNNMDWSFLFAEPMSFNEPMDESDLKLMNDTDTELEEAIDVFLAGSNKEHLVRIIRREI